jgi:hypothetical protein
MPKPISEPISFTNKVNRRRGKNLNRFAAAMAIASSLHVGVPNTAMGDSLALEDVLITARKRHIREARRAADRPGKHPTMAQCGLQVPTSPIKANHVIFPSLSMVNSAYFRKLINGG